MSDLVEVGPIQHGPTLSLNSGALFRDHILLHCSKGSDPVGNLECRIQLGVMRINEFEPFTSLQGIPICFQIWESKKKNTNQSSPI